MLIHPDKSKVRHATAGDDVIKNLFKVLCGVIGLHLKQRGINPLDDRLVESYIKNIGQSRNQMFDKAIAIK